MEQIKHMFFEFTYGKWFKIIMLVFLIILTAVFLILLFLSFFDAEAPLQNLYIIAPISISLISLCLLGIRDLFVSKVILSVDYISAKNCLSNRKLRIEEIKGYKINKEYIFIYPKNNFKKRIKISNFISDDGKIIFWLKNNFTDFKLADEEKEEKEFYRNSEYGVSSKDKIEFLNRAIKIAKFTKITCISLTLLVLFLIKYFNEDSFIYILVFLPLIVIFIVIFFKGIIKYDEKKEDEKTIYPNVLWGLLAPIFGLLLHTLFTINILKYDAVWDVLIYATFIIFFLCIYGSKDYKFSNVREIGTVFSLLLFSAMYSYSLILISNKFFDDSTPILYKASIMEKRISKGKRTNYYFKLYNKKLSKDKEEFYVTKFLYNTKNVGDSIKVKVKQGKLNIPYYKVE